MRELVGGGRNLRFDDVEHGTGAYRSGTLESSSESQCAGPARRIRECLRGGHAVLFPHHHRPLGVDDRAGAKQLHLGTLARIARIITNSIRDDPQNPRQGIPAGV